MILKNITSTLTLFAVLMLSMAGVFTSHLPAADAQTDIVENLLCPIIGDLSISFVGTEETYQVDDEFFQKVEIQNNSDYTLGGVRVMVAAYYDSTDTVPAYWMVLPDQYQLTPGLPNQINIETDLSILPSGEYTLKAFTIQGDETALLGAAMRDVEHTDGITIVKSTAQKNLVEVSVMVDEQYFTGETITIAENNPIEAKLVIKNNNEHVFIGSSILGVITQGEVPLGAAVREDKMSAVKLAPGAIIGHPITDNFIERGPLYTIYTGLVSPGSLGPVVAVPVQVADYTKDGSWSYISKIGLLDYSLKSDSEVIVCVDSVGANQGTGLIHETSAAKFTISTEAGEVTSNVQMSNETGNKNYFTFTPGVTLEDFIIGVDLLQQRFYSEDSDESEDPDTRDRALEKLYVVDTISSQFICSDAETCLPDTVAPIVFINHEKIPFKNSFWFYAGVMIAAALLLYIVLRRLDPQETDRNSKTNSDELQ